MQEKQKKSGTLFVVIDPIAETQLALEKAMSIAQACDFDIHAFVCVYESAGRGVGEEARWQQKASLLQTTEERVENLLQNCREAEIACDSEVAWNSNWVDSALRSITRSNYALVVKSNFDYSKAKRRYSRNSDFSLMRYSNSPVLFTSRPEPWDNKRLLACVEVQSADDDHNRLNAQILKQARRLADLLDLELEVATCFRDRILFRPEIVANRFKVLPEQVHLYEGPIIESLQQVYVDLDPAILMLGTIARKGFGDKLVGSTTEKLLDLVETDILTVV